MRRLLFVWLATLVASVGFATPEFVEHYANTQVYGEPSGVTMREPEVPREDESIVVWARVGYSFYYTDVAVYYTTDGSTPSGAYGVPTGTTQVLRSSAGQVAFVRNEPTGFGNVDWWKATLPSATRGYGTRVRYRIGAWHSSGGIEVNANNAGCSDGVCNDVNNTPTIFEFTNKLAWPGQGSAFVDHTVGYPPVSFWKEEAVAGNNWINVQLDQNGTLYDVYYPGAGTVRGIGTKNEGYVDGPDTFPPGLPLGSRGQMHFNQAMGGLRVDGKTYWLSNSSGGDYSNVVQRYETDANTVYTEATLTAAGNNLRVEQYDFAPAGISFPTTLGGDPNRGVYVKRYIITNQSGATKKINFYYFVDPALNGGDNFDAMYTDSARGAMVMFDNAGGTANSRGEYNPTTFGDYDKNVSVYFGASVKVCSAVGSSGGTLATDFWRDTSGDNDKGWSGVQITLLPGQQREIDVALVGGFDPAAGMTGTYAWQVGPVLDWFAATSMATVLQQTRSYWTSWLDQGTTVDLPDNAYDDLFKRSLLATALHLDGKGGGVVAGMHNGAYPFVWPRDAVYAAMTLARTGHFDESREVYRYLRDVAYRGNESWGKGFFYQKYTTDGYIVWSAPQVDETAAVPWGVWQHYLLTGDIAFLQQNYPMVYSAARASSEDSALDSRLFYDDANKLMHSMNVWEDSFDDFLYSNAGVWRALEDACNIATALGYGSDASLFSQRRADIYDGIRGRLAWNGENTDISQLGLVYPFGVLSPTDADAVRTIDRMNGVAADRYGNVHPLVNFSGEWTGLINRYWGDGYWNGGPWFLSTLWYGLYYADRADSTAGRADIDNLKYRIDLCRANLGPAGLGAEQISPSNSLHYPSFRLQAAWPNAWESMSTLIDAMMAFLDYSPDAPANRIAIAPKLPTVWSSMAFRNLRLGTHRIDVAVSENVKGATHVLTNVTGQPVNFSTWVRVPPGKTWYQATVNGVPATSVTKDPTANRVRIQGAMATGANAQTVVKVQWVGKSAAG